MADRDTSWHRPFLQLVESGASFTEAIKELGGNTVTLYNHFRDDPDFRLEAVSLRYKSGRPLTGAPSRAWDEAPRVLALFEAGLSFSQIAYVLAVHPWTISDWVHHREPDIGEAVEALKAATGRSRNHRTLWPVPEEDLFELLRRIAAGATLDEACAATGIAKSKMQRWRRLYSQVDAAIVAAAMDGRQRQVKPYPGLTCPGPHCGKKTGYDYGCADAPCRSAVAAQMARLRRERTSHA